MVMASRSNGNFADDEDDLFTHGEYNHRGAERRIKVDMDNAVDHSSEQKASSPRSKHSATEQRRRTKINERFGTLINLIPPSDQKRDKASLLLEVIEYIRLLQDKVQKYESSLYPLRIQDSTKLTPWRANQGYPSEVAALLPCIGAGPAIATKEPETSGVNPSSGHDQFIHDEELSDLSSIYSQRLLERLTGSMEVVGMDLTKVNVSVKVKMRRSTEKCSTKDPLSSPPEKRPKPNLS